MQLCGDVKACREPLWVDLTVHTVSAGSEGCAPMELESPPALALYGWGWEAALRAGEIPPSVN